MGLISNALQSELVERHPFKIIPSGNMETSPTLPRKPKSWPLCLSAQPSWFFDYKQTSLLAAPKLHRLVGTQTEHHSFTYNSRVFNSLPKA